METNRDINFDKRILRREILEKRDALPEAERRQISSVITEKLLAFPAYLKSSAIFAFVSYGSEVNTHDLIVRALADGKEVYCPKVEGMKMDFYQISGLEDLTAGYKGILEPRDGLKTCTDWNKKILMIMPGSVFDRNRNRMGYGKGFYDRFIEECRQNKRMLTTAALAFSMQIVDSVPAQEHDYSPDYIITEKEIIGVKEEL